MVERQLRRRGIDDERVLAAMAEVPREAFVPAAPAPPRLRRLGAADRRGADDLPALDRRRDLPGAGADAAPSGCSRSAPAPATRPRCSRCSPPRWSASSATSRSPRGAGEALAALGGRQRRAGRRRRQPSASPSGRPFEAIAVHATAPGAAAGAARPARRGRPAGRPARRRRRRHADPAAPPRRASSRPRRSAPAASCR